MFLLLLFSLIIWVLIHSIASHGWDLLQCRGHPRTILVAAFIGLIIREPASAKLEVAITDLISDD